MSEELELDEGEIGGTYREACLGGCIQRPFE